MELYLFKQGFPQTAQQRERKRKFSTLFQPQKEWVNSIHVYAPPQLLISKRLRCSSLPSHTYRCTTNFHVNQRPTDIEKSALGALQTAAQPQCR